MNMKKVKTRELTGAALDWAVAVCEGRKIAHDPMGFGGHTSEGGYWVWEDHGIRNPKTVYAKIGRQYSPSTLPAQGHPIIERELICTICPSTGDFWDARKPTFPPDYVRGPTPLIAAMRCYVASKMGEEIDIPEELVA
jgi:hypothetical protein